MTDAETKEEFTFPIMGEDISWCERVHQAGFDVWLDPSIRLTHHKMMKLTWEGIRP
jgi:GT2 family glycosyltransferase